MTDAPKYIGDLYVTEMTYELYLNGRITCHIMGVPRMGGEVVNSNRYGLYACEKGSGKIYFSFSDSNDDSVSVMDYYGSYVETIYSKFYLTGANSDGELAGDFIKLSYMVDGPGTISGERTQFLKNGADATTVQAVPGLGAEFVEWSDGVKEYSRKDSDITEDTTLSARFEQVTPLVNVIYNADSHGTIVGYTNQTIVKGGTTASVTAETRSEGNWYFVRWSDGVKTATRTDTNVLEDFTVTAIFSRLFNLHYSTDYLGENIVGERDQYLLDGEDGTPVTATTDREDLYFERWSDGVTTATRQDTNVTHDISVTAIFGAKNPVNYSVDEDYRGHIEGATRQWVKGGEDATAVTAVPNVGYVFVRWSDGVTTATRQDTNVQNQVNVYAVFGTSTTPVYALTYIAGDNGSISGQTSQTVASGEDGQSVTAVPDEGYEFDHWSDGITTATRQDTNVTSNIEVTAIFVAKGESTNDPGTPENTTDFAGGKGTKSNPYKISTIEQLNNVGNYPSSCFILINDIDLPIVGEGESNFMPLFSDETCFQGSLDGNGKTITNLTIYNDETFYTGLFGYIGEDGSVKNLILRDMNITGANYIGGICGYSLGAITNCDVSGDIKHVNANNYKVYIGGIVGRTENCIDNNKSAGTIVFEDGTKEPYIGGITGYCEYNSVNGSNSSMEISSGYYVGGLIGYVIGDISMIDVFSTGDIHSSFYGGGLIGSLVGDGIILEAYAKGNIFSSYVGGGIIGYSSGNHFTLTNAYSTGNVTVTTEGDIVYGGGLIGKMYYNYPCTISNVYATGNVFVEGVVSNIFGGGLIGYLEKSTFQTAGSISNSYATGNVSITGRGYCYCVGGLIGYGDVELFNSYATGNISIITSDPYGNGQNVGGLIGFGGIKVLDSFATGDISVESPESDHSSLRVGGLIGEMRSKLGNNPVLTISNSYATGKISITGGVYSTGGLIGIISSDFGGVIHNISNSYANVITNDNGVGTTGGIVGIVGSNTKIAINNLHWMKNAGSGAEYAVGYCDSLGVPTNMGTTKHTDITDFYTLADTLNEGQEEAVWENKDENSLPTLIVKEIEKE